MTTMSMTRVGLKQTDIVKALTFLEIIADAQRFKAMVSEIKAEKDLAMAEQAKALEYSKNASKLKESDNASQRAHAMERAARETLTAADKKANKVIEDAKSSAAGIVQTAQDSVATIRGDIERRDKESAQLKQATDRLNAQAKDLKERAVADSEKAQQELSDIRRRAAQMRELAQ